MFRRTIQRPARAGAPPGPTARASWLTAVMIATVCPIFGVMAADPPPAEDPPKPAAGDKPLRFTDDDLEKYKKPAPGAPKTEAEAPAAEAQPAKPPPAPAPGKSAPAAGKSAPVAGKTPAPTAPAARPPLPPLAHVPRPAPGAAPSTLAPPAAPVRPPTAARPVPSATRSALAPPPAEDPLKRWKDREALEAFREEQLRTLRGQISGLESRLEYLNLKRLSILDPTRIMPAPQTVEDRATDQGKGSRELLAIVEKEIETAEADLKTAKEALINIETRFAQESGQP